MNICTYMLTYVPNDLIFYMKVVSFQREHKIFYKIVHSLQIHFCKDHMDDHENRFVMCNQDHSADNVPLRIQM